MKLEIMCRTIGLLEINDILFYQKNSNKINEILFCLSMLANVSKK